MSDKQSKRPTPTPPASTPSPTAHTAGRAGGGAQGKAVKRTTLAQMAAERKTPRSKLVVASLPYDKDYDQLTPVELRSLTTAQRVVYQDRLAWRRVAEFFARLRVRAGMPTLHEISRVIRDDQGYSFVPSAIREYHLPSAMRKKVNVDATRLAVLQRYYGVSDAELERVKKGQSLATTGRTDLINDIVTILDQLSPQGVETTGRHVGIQGYEAGIPIPPRIGRLLPPRPAVAYLPGTVAAVPSAQDAPQAQDVAIDEEAQLQQAEAALAAESAAYARRSQEVQGKHRNIRTSGQGA